MKTYSGRCHCGAIQFRLRSEEIKSAYRCNCSICVRKGTVMSTAYYAPGDLEIDGIESTTVYRFGDRMVNHYFCHVCGVHPFHDATTNPGHFRVNLGCIEGLDALALPVTILDRKTV